MKKKVIYIAGPFRGPSAWAIAQNIRAAETHALQVWRLGAVALCPHLNTANFQGALPDEVWLEGDLELVKRCDAVLLLPTWQASSGTRAERQFAINHHIPVLYDLGEVMQWLRDQK